MMSSFVDTFVDKFLGCFCERDEHSISNVKQKIVIKVHFTSEKCRTKALKVAAKAKGVSNVGLVVEKEHVEVVGNGVDSVFLVRSLKKKLGSATLVTVEEVKKENEKEKEKEKEKPADPIPIQYWTSSYIHHPEYGFYRC